MYLRHITCYMTAFPVAAEKLKKITESPTAWQSQYSAVMEEADELRAPECAEKFMQLIAGITGNGKNVVAAPCVHVSTCLTVVHRLPPLFVWQNVTDRSPSCFQSSGFWNFR